MSDSRPFDKSYFAEAVSAAVERWTIRHTLPDSLLRAKPPLSAHDLADLRGSGLSDETIVRCRFYTGEGSEIAIIRNWSQESAYLTGKGLGAALVIPFLDRQGGPTGFARVKPHKPREVRNRDGTVKPVKYEQPRGLPIRPYIPPMAWPLIDDPAAPLLVTEGEKKAIAATQAGYACVGLTGVDCWSVSRPKGDRGPRVLLPDLAALPLGGREVYVAFDSDAATNPNVRRAEMALGRALAGRGAAVRILRLPAGPAGEKVGLDDLLLARGPAGLDALIAQTRQLDSPLVCYQESHMEGEDLHEILGNTITLLGISPPPPGGACPAALAAAKPLLRHLVCRDVARAICAPCRRWTCCVCYRRLVWARAPHYAGAIQGHAGPIYALVIPAAGWAALKVRLSRSKANYIRADPGGGVYSVLATTALPGAEVLEGDDRVRRLGDVLRAIQRRPCAARGKPVLTSSRAWKPPAAAEAERAWERVSAVHVRCPDPVVEMLRSKGINPGVSRSGDDPVWLVEWVFPATMLPLDRAAVFAHLAQLRDLEEDMPDGPPLPPGEVPW